jgi:hypothetical protein
MTTSDPYYEAQLARDYELRKQAELLDDLAETATSLTNQLLSNDMVVLYRKLITDYYTDFQVLAMKEICGTIQEYLDYEESDALLDD